MGTAASEGIPNPFCNCKVCTYAREHGGANVRTRASAMVDNHILIDMSPEWSAQLKRENMTAREIDTVLFTHTHPDHTSANSSAAPWDLPKMWNFHYIFSATTVLLKEHSML